MSNAAILLHPDGYDTTGPRLLGRHAAGESFLRGFLRHADVEQFNFWNAVNRPREELEALIRGIEPPRKPLNWISIADRQALAAAGVLHLAGPDLAAQAWARSLYGASAYSICGLTHTISTQRTMDMLSQLVIAPVEAHDALICTSKAVRDSVEVLLEGVHDFLAREYGGPRQRPQPQRVTIPLGVNVDDFQTSPEHRRAWRERLDIPTDAVVALYVGRFNARDKMNPALMALALEMAAQQTGRTLYWVNSGWAEDHEDAERFHADTCKLCPSVEYRCVDGRAPDTRFSIWSVADVFISFSDNIQETFGLTPVEAMAAGLPCVVSDWDGYRDTVRHGDDGFRIPTVAPAPGDGLDLAYWHAERWMSYLDYVGAANQATAIDLGEAARAISILVLNAEFRRKLGRQAQARAREVFDWAAVIPQYQALWAELNARRHAAGPAAPQANNPFRPDPFALFAGYPTRHFGKAWTVELNRALTWPDIEQRLTLPLTAYSAFNRPSLDEVRRLVAWLTERPSASVADVVALFPAMRQGPIERGLLWIARYGVVSLQPPA